MIVIDRLLVGGIRFVLDKVATAVEQELSSEDSLREELLAAQMKVELGEMTEDEFAQVERDVMARIRELKEREGAPSGPLEFKPSDGGDQITSVEASFESDESD